MVLVRAPAVRADETDRVRVVDHDRRVVTLRKVADLRQGRHVAVHREHAIGHHHPETRTCALLEPALEVLHVAVRVAKTLRLAEADAVDDAGVVEGVRDHGVAFVEQRFEDAAVRVEAGRVKDRVLGPEELGKRLLQLLVHLLRATDEAHRRHAVAPAVERLLGRCHDLGMIREAQVVVGAQIEHLPVHDGDRRALRRADHALRLLEPRLPDLL